MDYLDIINYISNKIILDALQSSINNKYGGSYINNDNDKDDNLQICINYLKKIFPSIFEDNKLRPELYELYNNNNTDHIGGSKVLHGIEDGISILLNIVFSTFFYLLFYKFIANNNNFYTVYIKQYIPIKIIKILDKLYDNIKSIGIIKCFFYLNLISLVFIAIRTIRFYSNPITFLRDLLIKFGISIFTRPLFVFLRLFQLFGLDYNINYRIERFIKKKLGIPTDRGNNNPKEEDNKHHINIYSDEINAIDGGNNNLIENKFSIINNVIESFQNASQIFIDNKDKIFESEDKQKFLFDLLDKELLNIANQDFKYKFDIKSGLILCESKPDNLILKTKINNKPEIIMITNKDKTIDYTINNIILNSSVYSLIEGNPIHTALVLSYKYYYLENLPKEITSNYKYYLNPNGTVDIFNDKKEEVSSVKLFIKSNNNDSIKKDVCTKIFGLNYDKNTCSKHFYNIIGRAGLGLLQNLNESNIDKIKESLLEANPEIQYEILKTLEWKIKIDKFKKKKLISVDEWLQQLNSNQIILYQNYLNSNKTLKELLENIINLLNKTSLLYPEIRNKPEINSKRKKRIN